MTEIERNNYHHDIIQIPKIKTRSTSANKRPNKKFYVCPFCNHINFTSTPLDLFDSKVVSIKKNRKCKSNRRRGHFTSRKTWLKHMLKFHSGTGNTCLSPTCCLDFDEKTDLFNHMLLSHYPSLFIRPKIDNPD